MHEKIQSIAAKIEARRKERDSYVEQQPKLVAELKLLTEKHLATHPEFLANGAVDKAAAAEVARLGYLRGMIDVLPGAIAKCDRAIAADQEELDLAVKDFERQLRGKVRHKLADLEKKQMAILTEVCDGPTRVKAALSAVISNSKLARWLEVTSSMLRCENAADVARRVQKVLAEFEAGNGPSNAFK
jgi:hypothetical protein